MESPDSLPSVQCNIDAKCQQLRSIAMKFDRHTSRLCVDVDLEVDVDSDGEGVGRGGMSEGSRVAGWVGPFAANRRIADPEAVLPVLSVISSPNSRKRGQSPSLQVWDLRPSRVAHPTMSASSNTHLPTTPTPYHLNLAIFGIALHRTDNTANYSINSKINDNKNNMQSVKIRLVLDNINYFENKGIVNKKYLIYDISLILCVPQFIKNNYSNVKANVSELKRRKYKVIEVMIDTKNLGAFPQILENKSRCYKKTVDNVCDSNLIIKCILINQIFGRMPDDSIPVIKNAITVQGIVYGHPHSHSFNPNLMYKGVALNPLLMNKSDYAFIDKTRIISNRSVFIESDSVSKKSICQNTQNCLTSRFSKTAEGGVEDFPICKCENTNSNMLNETFTRFHIDNKAKDENERDNRLPIDIKDVSEVKRSSSYSKFMNGEFTFKSLLRLCEEAPMKINHILGNRTATGKVGGWQSLKMLGLLGGGESSLNAASGWGSPPNTNTNNGGANNWSGNASSGNQSGSGNNLQQQWANTNQRPPGSQQDSNSNKVNNVTSGGNASNSVAPPTGPSGNWTTSGPNSNMPASSQSNNSSQPIPPVSSVGSGGNNSPSASTAAGAVNPANTSGSSTGTSAPPTTAKSQLEQLNTMREALFSQEGWGGQHVNQDTNWDVPTSPEPGVKIDQQGGPPVWKPNINNGTDLWEANLRNGGQPPPQPVVKTPWGHTPTSNIGGTWGEDDDTPESSNVWTGPPTGPPPQWGGGPPQQPPPWTGAGKKDDWGGWGEPHRPDIHRPEMHARDLRPPAPDPREMRVIMGIDGRGDIRGDPHGISGRLNGSADMWGQHHMPHMQAPPNKMMPTNVGNGVNQWGAQGPKDMQISKSVTGWDEPSPPAARRNMPNFDDGTSLWGQQRSGVGPWKDMPGGMGRGAMQCPPVMPPNRMPGVAPNQIKPDGMWGHPHRNGSWEDNLSHPANWEKESGNSWNEGPMNQTGWMGSKTKPMGAPGGSWDADISDWRGPKPPALSSAAKLMPKDLIWNSKQFRALVDMGYKKDDVELALRSREMNFEEAAELLSQNRGSGGIETWRRHEDHPVGPHYDHQQQYSAPPRPQHPSFQPQQPPSVPFPPPGQGLASIGNMSPAVVQKILGQPASQQAPPFNQQNNQSGGSGQPSTAQLRMLVQQIQMAVSAGYLNHQILNQPLAPQTLVLLNQLLQQIKALQQLASQQNLMHNTLNSKGNNVGLQITVQITKAKQQITNLQNQIAAQQAIYVKQQNNSGSSSTASGGDFFNKPHESLSQLQNNFSDLTLSKDVPSTYSSSSGQQSRLNQWKLPSLDKEEGSEFSRAPGTTTKPTTSPQLNPLPLQSDSNTWAAGRTVNDGWPSSDNADLPDGKEPWPSSQPPQTSTYTDLVAEFEPGKPWKMKSIEDDPAITPGSVVRSPLSLAPMKDPDIFGSGNQGKASPTTPSERSLSSSTWSYPQPTPTSTPSSFNITKGSSSKTWGDTPTTGASDLWSSGPSMTKSRGQLSATSTTKPSSSWGGGTASQPQRPSSYSQQPNWQSTWLLLKNLTAQIDGSTLKTLCMQHGPLQSFHLYLNQGIALSKYSTRDEASKAQSALNNCVLGNTTIFAESPGEADVNMILQHLGQGAGSGQWRGTGSKGAGGPATSDTWGFSLWDSQLEQRATPSLASFLPTDLLGGESM